MMCSNFNELRGDMNFKFDVQKNDSDVKFNEIKTQNVQITEMKPAPVSYTHLDVYKRQVYSNETWTLTGTNEKRIRTAEMKMLWK